jgi:tol-pal system protein YbgF
MVPIKGYVLALVILLLTACVNQEAMVRKQDELESRLESLAKGSVITNQQIQELNNQIHNLREQTNATDVGLREAQEHIRKLSEEATAQSQQHITTTSTDTNTQKIELVNEAPIVPHPNNDGRLEAYMKAFGLYSANHYEEAITAFSSYIKTYPHAEYAANAQYWIGECYYSISNFPKALKAFKKVTGNYPQGNKAPDAMLKTSYTLFSLKQPDKAVAVLEALIAKYPTSQAATKARERLRHQ